MELQNFESQAKTLADSKESQLCTTSQKAQSRKEDILTNAPLLLKMYFWHPLTRT